MSSFKAGGLRFTYHTIPNLRSKEIHVNEDEIKTVKREMSCRVLKDLYIT